MDYATIIYVAITLTGIIYGSYAGYKEAKKADSSVTFSFESFILSILRSLPGIIASVATFAVMGISLEAGITAFFAGVGSDVVIKRSWRAVTS